MTLELPSVQRAWHAVSKAKAASAALDFLGEDLSGRQHALDMTIFKKLESGEVLDPNLAMQVFLQKWAVWQFMNKMLHTLKTGEGAGRTLGPMLSEGGVDGAEG